MEPESFAANTPPGRLGSTGTKFVHYGPIWDQTLEAVHERGEGPVAVLVCHGMGQQVRYETISAVAQSILTEAEAECGNAQPLEVHLTQANDDFLGRAEVKWTDKANRAHEVHVYEAYWAPLTEGKVTYWDTIKFLLLAAWNCVRYSSPRHNGKFDRWMFGGRKTLSIRRWGLLLLFIVLVVLLAQVCITGYVSIGLVQAYKSFLSHPLPAGIDVFSFLSWRRWVGSLVPKRDVWRLIGDLLTWLLAIGSSLAWSNFVVEYLGDVAAYVSPYKDSRFDDIRHQIQKIGFNVGKIIYGFGLPLAAAPKYKKLVIVGHSLGSVLAYDTLNALINLDSVSSPADRRNVAKRTRALITFGSPLDKTAFIFRMQTNCDQDWIREQMVASAQPLILDYDHYRLGSFAWVNIWSPMDIISGSLDYYDDPAIRPGDSRHVQNKVDPQARIPLMAHVQYWGNALLREEIYKSVCNGIDPSKSLERATALEVS